MLRAKTGYQKGGNYVYESSGHKIYTDNDQYSGETIADAEQEDRDEQPRHAQRDPPHEHGNIHLAKLIKGVFSPKMTMP